MLASRPRVFVVPDDHERISGGNLYNRSLIAACQAIGRPVEVVRHGELWAVRPPSRAVDVIIDSVLHPSVGRIAGRLLRDSRTFLLLHHLPSFEPERASGATIARETALLAPLDGFIATSGWTARKLRHERQEMRPILVLPPAPVLDVTGPTPPPPAPPLRASMVASLMPCKGVLAFLEALASRVSGEDDFTLTVLGRDDFDPGYARACRALAARAPLRGRVRIRAPVPAARMPGLHSRSHVLISASSTETYGMAVAEARAFGRFVLARHAGNLRQHLRQPEAGRLCGTVDELARHFIGLVRDPVSLRATAAAAYRARRRRQATWPALARRLVTALDGAGAEKQDELMGEVDRREPLGEEAPCGVGQPAGEIGIVPDVRDDPVDGEARGMHQPPPAGEAEHPLARATAGARPQPREPER